MAKGTRGKFTNQTCEVQVLVACIVIHYHNPGVRCRVGQGIGYTLACVSGGISGGVR